MNRKTLAATPFLCMLMLLSACSWPGTVVRGSGKVSSETRAVSGFSSVRLSGVGDVVLTQDGTPSLELEADDNLLPYLTSTVDKDGVLELGTKPGVTLRDTKRIVWRVHVKDLRAIDVSGAGNVRAGAINTPALDVSVSGASDVTLSGIDTKVLTVAVSGAGGVTLSGSAAKQSFEMSGVGNVDGRALSGRTGRAEVSGSGELIVNTSDTLAVTISGAASVKYLGDPALTQSISGAGSVTPLTP
jgi:hypothetical protein